jgi:hypothetical protein
MLREKLLDPPPTEQPAKQSNKQSALDKKLATIAERLHANLGDRSERNRKEWVAIKLEVAGDLFKARALFRSNAGFADWLMEENLYKSITKDDRAALIGLGEHLAIAREILEVEYPDCWSVRTAWNLVRERLPSSQSAKTVAKKSKPEPAKSASAKQKNNGSNGTAMTPADDKPVTERRIGGCKATLMELEKFAEPWMERYQEFLPDHAMEAIKNACSAIEAVTRSKVPASKPEPATTAVH